LRLLLDPGAVSGKWRSDAVPRDAIRVSYGMWYLPSGPESQGDVGRMLELVIDGLGYGLRRSQAAAGALMLATAFESAHGQSSPARADSARCTRSYA